MRFTVRSFCSKRASLFLALFFVLVTGRVLGKTAQNLTLEQVRSMIEQRGYHWTAGKTSVSELSAEEFQKLLGIVVPRRYEERLEQIQRLKILAPGNLPSVFDWRDSSGVTPVKSQGGCGSCWDFCATAAFEAMIQIYDGRLVDLIPAFTSPARWWTGSRGGLTSPMTLVRLRLLS